MGFVAIAAIATSASVVVVALAFALYALVQPYIGNAGASAVVAGVFALIVGIGGLAAAPAAGKRTGRPRARRPAWPRT